MTKSQLVWSGMLRWCEANPEKKAAIVGKEGRFEIVWVPHKPSSAVSFHSCDNAGQLPDWIKNRFFLDETPLY